MMNNPQIKVTLEHMRQEMIHAFGTQSAQMQDQFERSLEVALKEFDYEKEVKVQAAMVLSAELREAMQSVFRGLQWDKAIRAAIVQAIQQELAKPKSESAE